MAFAEQYGRADLSAVLERAGLPREAVAAWLDSGDGQFGDFSGDVERYSRRWRLGADLLARLPANHARKLKRRRGMPSLIAIAPRALSFSKSMSRPFIAA